MIRNLKFQAIHVQSRKSDIRSDTPESIYNFNKNGKMRGRKDIWCAKSEVIFFNFECVLHYTFKVKDITSFQ
jgi:hypothetical protein